MDECSEHSNIVIRCSLMNYDQKPPSESRTHTHTNTLKMAHTVHQIQRIMLK